MAKRQNIATLSLLISFLIGNIGLLLSQTEALKMPLKSAPGKIQHCHKKTVVKHSCCSRPKAQSEIPCKSHCDESAKKCGNCPNIHFTSYALPQILNLVQDCRFQKLGANKNNLVRRFLKKPPFPPPDLYV